MGISNTEIKEIRIFHDFPKNDKGLIMLPIGLYYNRAIQNCKKGDRIVFLCGTERKVVCKSLVNLKSSVSDFLCRYIYGVKLSIVFKKWLTNAVLEGHGRKVVSENRCLVVWYE